MKKIAALLLAGFMSVLLLGCVRTDESPYLGRTPPGMKPEIFAPGVISKAGFHLHSCPVFSPDGNEIYFTKMVFDPVRQGTICVMKQKNGRWTGPDTASFSGEYSDDSPAFTPDGNRLYFSSVRPVNDRDETADLNFWYVEKKEGGWSEPVYAGNRLNTEHCDFRLSISQKGTIYFSTDRGCDGCGSFDIYRTDSTLTQPVLMDDAVSSPVTEQVGFIAPDERYLIFYRYDRNQREETGLHISFRNKNGSWSPGKNMGKLFNSPPESCTQAASLSPDGKYIFFLRRYEESIYWMDSGIIETLFNNQYDDAANQ